MSRWDDEDGMPYKGRHVIENPNSDYNGMKRMEILRKIDNALHDMDKKKKKKKKKV